MEAARIYGAARTIQKYLRGMLVRKHVNKSLRAYYFFKKVHKRALIRQLVHGMNRAYLQVKEVKQRMLKKYIYYCATKIQSLWRGCYARRIKAPVRARLGKRITILEAVALGWKVRRIMKTKEVVNRVT